MILENRYSWNFKLKPINEALISKAEMLKKLRKHKMQQPDYFENRVIDNKKDEEYFYDNAPESEKLDKSTFREILASLHDSRRDMSDYVDDDEFKSKEDSYQQRLKKLIGDVDINQPEDWSNVNWDEEDDIDDEDEDEEISKVSDSLHMNWRHGTYIVKGPRAIDSLLNRLAYNEGKDIPIHICDEPDGDEYPDEFFISPKRSNINNRGSYRLYALKTEISKDGKARSMIDPSKDFDISAMDVDNIDIYNGDILITLKHPVASIYDR